MPPPLLPLQLTPLGAFAFAPSRTAWPGLKILRMVRLARILRIVRVVRFFSELRAARLRNQWRVLGTGCCTSVSGRVGCFKFQEKRT